MAKQEKKDKARSKTEALTDSSTGTVASVRVSWYAILLVAVATFAAFWPALSNDFVDWDDTDNFVRNHDFRGLGWSNLTWMFSTFHMGHYQPLAWLTLGWDAVWGQWVFGPHQVHGPGMNARAYHITNSLLHTINAVLVYVLALRLITWPTMRCKNWPAWLPQVAASAAALVFSLHPLRVENVAWITERRDLVSAVLLLLTMLAWLRAVHPDRGQTKRWYWTSILLYTLSLVAKVAGVPLVAVLLVLDWYPLRRIGTLSNPFDGLLKPAGRRVLIEKTPFVMLALLFSAVATLGQSANNWIFPFERHQLLARIVQCFYGLTFYIWKTVVPTSLLPLYELRLPMPIGEPPFIAAIAIVIVCAVLLFVLRAKLPALVAAMICYAALLGPVLGLFQNGPQIVADRYAYLPAIGLSMVIGSLLLEAWRGLPRLGFALCCAMMAGVLGTLAGLTWAQTQVWRNTNSLWAYNCSQDPGSSFSQNGYGYVLLTAGDIDAAIPCFQESIRIKPDNHKAHENLWIALERKGDLARLLRAYESASAVPQSQFPAVLRKANRLLNDAKAPESIPFFELACRLHPDDAEARNNYGLALARMGRRDRAEEQYRIAIQLDPNLFTARYNSGLNYRALNRIPEARECLEMALRLKPGHQGAIDALRSLSRPPVP